ncbi:MAG: TVP38/TMEM64 family protein [Oscillospiraceae bacterium]|nr:TVP38/TMEM64 family protein [Oscillospiraceae bacterium]
MESKINVSRNVVNLLSLLGLIATVVLCVWGISSGVFTSQEKLESFVQAAGPWGPALFMLLQTVQVIVPIIPGGITNAAGVILFGPLMGFVYNYISICTGSILVFCISRRYGMPVIRALFRQKTIDKYIGWLDRGKAYERFFAAAIFFPMAPDDFLCYLTGLTKMDFKKYVLIILLCKPFSIFLYSMGLAAISRFLLNI